MNEVITAVFWTAVAVSLCAYAEYKLAQRMKK